MKTTTLMVRGLRTNIQEWGNPDNPTLVLLHGWMDCGATFKYMAQYLSQDYYLVAPDLRGFGDTEHADGYWFPDYLADLHVLLEHYSPTQKVHLVGHSMGGNIVGMYAGIQPDRVARALILEGIGLPPTKPKDAPKKYRQWMSEILSDEPSKVYPNVDALKNSIAAVNPSLSASMVDDLAQLWGKPFGDDGQMQLKHDHKHRYTNPIRYNYDDMAEIWKEVTATVGLVMANDSWMYQRFTESGRIEQAKTLLDIKDNHYWVVERAGHMLHIEQAQQTAQCVREFFAG